MVYNTELKREIPFGWLVGCFGDYSKLKGGFAFKSSWWTDKGLKVIKIKDINEDYSLSIDKCSIVDENKYEITKNYEAFSGDVVIAMTGATVGKFGIVPKTEKPILVNQRVGLFKLGKNPTSRLPFLINSLNQDYFRQTVFVLANGAAQPNISSDQIDAIPLVIPELEIIEKFNSKFQYFYDKMMKNIEENQQLTELRDWLLPMLMNGQVTVGDENAFGKDEVLAMVAEPIAVYEKTEKKPAKTQTEKKTKKEKTPVVKLNNVDVYKRTLLAAEIVYQYKNEYTLGHLKLQKMLYLCKESENMNLPMNFLKQAMGPYDNQLARSLDKQFEEKKWFKYQNKDGLKYTPLENCGKHSEDFKKYFEDQLDTISKLIATFRKFTSPNIEAVATLFACWKEAIENNELINDSIIIKKFYNWSQEKEKFIQLDLVKHLGWMRENGIYPKKK